MTRPRQGNGATGAVSNRRIRRLFTGQAASQSYPLWCWALPERFGPCVARDPGAVSGLTLKVDLVIFAGVLLAICLRRAADQ
jgi:hypothetical protein